VPPDKSVHTCKFTLFSQPLSRLMKHWHFGHFYRIGHVMGLNYSHLWPLYTIMVPLLYIWL